jgi:hypothetical protein
MILASVTAIALRRAQHSCEIIPCKGRVGEPGGSPTRLRNNYVMKISIMQEQKTPAFIL